MTDQTSDPLDTFVRDALAGARGEDVASEDIDEPEEGLETDDQAGEETEEATPKEAAAFWGSMSAEDRERAENDGQFAALLWEQWQAQADDGDDESDTAEGDPTDFVPQSANELVAWAAANEAGLRAEGWTDAGEFLTVAATDPRWWAETARMMSWSPAIRPDTRDLPEGLQLATTAAGVNRLFAEDRAREGHPLPDDVEGARVVADPFRGAGLRPPKPRW
jgi:hypothetical protein